MFKQFSRLGILSLLLLGALTLVLPVYAVAPTVNHNSSHSSTSSLTDTCTVTVDSINDVIVDIVQTGGNAVTTASVTDNQGNTPYLSTEIISNQMNARFFFANATHTGSTAITVTVSPNMVSIGSWCYDISRVVGTSGMAANDNSASSGSKSGLSVGNQNIPSNSIVLVLAQSYSGAATFTAGSGFTLNSGCTMSTAFIAYSCSEYSNPSGPTTSCPITSSVSQSYVMACVAFAPVIAAVTTTITNTSTVTTSTTKLGIIIQTVTQSGGLPTGNLPTLTPVQALIVAGAIVAGLAVVGITLAMSARGSKGRR